MDHYKIILAMVGLPARGKSYLARKLARFLNWAGSKSKVFNFGEYRRIIVGVDCAAEFFDNNNAEALKERDKFAILAINDLVEYLNGKHIKYNNIYFTYKKLTEILVFSMQLILIVIEEE